MSCSWTSTCLVPLASRRRGAAQIAPGTAVLVVTMVDDDTVFAALSAVARGHVLKGASADQIAAALRTVAAGGAVFGAGVATRLLAQSPRRLSGAAAPAPARRPDHAGTRGTRPAGRGC